MMKIYRIAADQGETRIDILETIFENAQGRRNSPMGIITQDSVERHVEGLVGTFYVATSYSEDKDAMVVQKYYENELAEQEYGRTVFIPLDYESPQETISKTNQVIEKLSQ